MFHICKGIRSSLPTFPPAGMKIMYAGDRNVGKQEKDVNELITALRRTQGSHLFFLCLLSPFLSKKNPKKRTGKLGKRVKE